MKVRLIVTLAVLLNFGNVSAQSHRYEPGYIVLKTDTLSGFIERTAETSLSRSINFKQSLSAEKKVYFPADISGFGFTEAALAFEPVWVEIIQDSIKSEFRFAKVMLTGELSLYFLQLEPQQINRIFLYDNTYVYIIKRKSEDQQNEYFTLSQFEYQNSNLVSLRKRYIGTLTFLLKDYLKNAKDDLYNLEFSDEAIMNIVEHYNAYKSPKNETVKFTYKVPAIIKYGIELSYGKMVSTGKSIPTAFRPGNTKVSDSHGVSVGFFWDILKPDLSNKISSSLGINYLNLNYSYSYKKEIIKVTQHALRFPVLVQANLKEFTTKKPLVFFNCGPLFEVATDQSFKHLDFWPYLSMGCGVYLGPLKYAFLMDNTSFLMNRDKFMRFSISFSQKRKAK